MALLQEIIQWCDQTLKSPEFKDYAPNGLQIEGKTEVNKILCAVTASQDAIEAAIAQKADLLLVHHGYFWKGEPAPITGIKGRRIRKLMQHGISMIGYHLPLDAHEEVGNNAEIARVLGLEIEQRAGSLELLCVGRPKDGSVPVEAFVERVAAAFGGIRVRVGEAGAEVRDTVAHRHLVTNAASANPPQPTRNGSSHVDFANEQCELPPGLAVLPAPRA